MLVAHSTPDIRANPENRSVNTNAPALSHDVIVSRGNLTHRVQLPAGRTLIGFGKGDVVYMMFRDGVRVWILERGRVGRSKFLPRCCYACNSFRITIRCVSSLSVSGNQ